MSKNKDKQKGRRGKRDYVGEDPETKDAIDILEEKEEIETKDPGFLDRLLKKDRKETAYQCSECQGITYLKPEDLQKHFEEEHGLIMIIEDVEQMKIELPKKDITAALKESEKTEAETKEIRDIQDKRILNTLTKPKTMDPKSIISELDAKTPEDVYRLASEKMANTPDLSIQVEETDSYYIEEIKGNSIEVSMIKRFPRTLETIEVLNKLKTLME
jgi:hypothetical protein